MKHGSLFSGIGGFDLAAEWMGWENKFHCEWNEFGQQILKYYWPDATTYGDITKTDFTLWRGRIDVLSGGFPCQPYSAAGKRKGKEDDRHLWPEMLRAIREISPRWVVGENVRGLTNWNGGMVFDEVQADLETAGYEVTPFLLPACAVNAPHRRDRIWFVAHAKDILYQRDKRKLSTKDGGPEFDNISSSIKPGAGLSFKGVTPNANEVGQRDQKQIGGMGGSGFSIDNFRDIWKEFPTVSPVCGRNDGFPGGLVGITIPKHRNESIKGFGNAVVPQVVYQIFKAIEIYKS